MYEERLYFFFPLTPSRLSIVQLQEKELPELKNRLQTVNREIERLKGDVEEKETQLAVLISEEETAKACLQDISLMDRYLVASSSRLFLLPLSILYMLTSRFFSLSYSSSP